MKNLNLNDFAAEVHANAVAHGWWEREVEFPEIIAMITSELFEALALYRDNQSPTEIYYLCEYSDGYDIDCSGSGKKCVGTAYDCDFDEDHATCKYRKKAPQGIPIEIADACLRLYDYVGRCGIDIDAAIKLKHDYNKTRPYRHGGKKC